MEAGLPGRIVAMRSWCASLTLFLCMPLAAQTLPRLGTNIGWSFVYKIGRASCRERV